MQVSARCLRLCGQVGQAVPEEPTATSGQRLLVCEERERCQEAEAQGR